MGRVWIAAFGVLAAAGVAGAQEGDAATDDDAALEEEPAWSFGLAVTAYAVPDDTDYLQPTFTADGQRIHLEARYNYEDLDTGSAWVGLNFSFGEEVTLDVTPMIGVVAGQTDGVAPGYELTLAWKWLELYSEGEYLFDFEESDDNFFYTWTELSASPTEGWRAGIVVQRTRAYETDLDIQRGLLLGFTHGDVDFTAYLLNIDAGEAPTIAVAVGFSF